MNICIFRQAPSFLDRKKFYGCQHYLQTITILLFKKIPNWANLNWTIQIIVTTIKCQTIHFGRSACTLLSRARFMQSAMFDLKLEQKVGRGDEVISIVPTLLLPHPLPSPPAYLAQVTLSPLPSAGVIIFSKKILTTASPNLRLLCKLFKQRTQSS